MRDFTVIIPTWNMGRYLEPLFASILESDFATVVQEIIFVCEKSNDGSEECIEKLILHQGNRLPKVRMIQPTERRGLFMARYLGAKAATTKTIMFIDSRITLPESSGKSLPLLYQNYKAMVANPDIDIRKNIYCLYWKRSHNAFYRRERDVESIQTITTENFNSVRIGGTCFFCSREPFVRLSEGYLKTAALFSDDTYIFADLVKIEPFVMHPEFRVNWEPRDTAQVFLKHLYGRGPGFAQYNFFLRRGPLFYTTLIAVLYGLTAIATLFVHPLWSLAMVLIGIAMLAASTALIAESVLEFFRLAPLHTAVLLYYGTGALRGIWMVWKRTGFTAPSSETMKTSN